ncbi:MAG: hypothetical protein DCC57_24445 [Chloroflexi bacterium]|nr:MAG: hypothetical protein DCC57_24445 [Chloroflexota bacterium]
MAELILYEQTVALPIREFLLIEQCPEAWRVFDLYIVRDGEIAFYIGQSYQAFDRVWHHIRDGHKARSVVGRFILRNWPSSLRYTVELRSSRAACFAALGHDLTAAENDLIGRLAPCFNRTANAHPTPLPDRYAPPSGPIRCSRNLKHLIREAGRARQAEQRRQMLDEISAGSRLP